MNRLLPFVLVLLPMPALAAPAMWSVAVGGAEITLYGTIHTLPPGVDWLTPAARQRFDAADTLVVETIIPDDRFALGALLSDLGTGKQLKPVLARIGPADRKRLPQAAANAGVSMLALDRMKPWLIAITLSEATLRAKGITAENGVEQALTVRAKAAGRPIVGLETVEQQLRFFDGLPAADQRALLSATLDELADPDVGADKLIAAWQRGDVEAIERDFDQDARATQTLRRVLLVDRNTRWANWIATVLKRPGKLFLAVGAGHFAGPDGLIARLRARGLNPVRIE